MRLFLAKTCILFSIPMTAMGNEQPLAPTGSLSFNRFDISFYESSGTAGPGILLIHGNTSTANSYARIMRSPFAQEYKVVAMDLPGYGLSQYKVQPGFFGHRPVYNVALWKAAIQEVAQATGVDGGILVGWSWGGDLAIQASTVLPNLKGLFIFGTAPMGGASKEAPKPFLTPEESYAGRAFYLGVTPLHTNKMNQRFVKSFFSEDYSTIPDMLYEDGWQTASGTRLAILLAGLGADWNFKDEIPLLNNLKIPLAMVHAEQDAFVNENYLRFIEKDLPTLWRGETTLVEDSGHIIQWEKPEEFTDLLRQFLADIADTP